MYPVTGNESKINFYLQQLQISQYFQSFLQTSSKFSYSSIIDFISNNLHSIDEDKLLTLPISTLHSILSNENLLIENEDWLLDFIEKVFKNRKESEIDNENDIYDFYSLLDLCSLSDNKFQEFISNIVITKITTSPWMKLQKCFFISQEQRNAKKSNKRYTINANSFKFDGNESHRFEGIIRYLTKESGGNVAVNGTVKVTASSIQMSGQEPKFAVDFDDLKNYFHSNSEQNSWLQFDFGERKVRPTHYSIKSRPDGGKGYYHLKNWTIEGSNTANEKDWKTLDTRNDITCLDGSNAIHTFDIQTRLNPDEYFRYLRIRITGPNSGNCYHLILSALEYFGSITQ